MPYRGYRRHSDTRGWNPLGTKQLLVHFMSVGNGHMAIVRFPSGKVMLIDSNVRQEDKDELLSYIDGQIPNGLFDEREIAAFICTHRDADHVRGIDLIHERFPIQQIWDAEVSGEGTDGCEYIEYMALRRQLREREGFLRSKRLYTLEAGLRYEDDSGATLECLNPPAPGSRTVEMEDHEKRGHIYCGVIRISYKGRSILVPGDVSWQAWRDLIVPRYGDRMRCDVLLAGHHGSKTFFTDTFEDAIDPRRNPDITYTDHLPLLCPKAVVISCEQNDHFPNAHALKLYQSVAKSSNGNPQVFTTHDWKHVVASVNSDGLLAVTPHWFVDHASHSRVLVNLRCERQKATDEWVPVDKEGGLTVGTKLRFTAWPTAPQCQIRPEDFRVDFYVSNAGEAEHENCHDIYKCQKNSACDSWNIQHRDLTYRGRHLLLCKVTSLKDRSHWAQEVFPVIGK